MGVTLALFDFSSGLWLSGKEPACNAEKWIRSLGQEDPLEEGMATHSRKKNKEVLSVPG
jgi:hypothetical protein